MSLNALLARVRVAADTGHLSPELAVEVLQALCAPKRSVPAKVQRRNQLLREAAALMAGSIRAKALRLEQETLRPTETEIGDLVRKALEVDRYRNAPSLRQLIRIIGM